MEFIPFSSTHIGAAAELLAARHRHDRQVAPDLPNRHERPVVAQAAIAALFDTGATGVIAIEKGRPVGYLLGSPAVSVLMGRGVWFQPAGHAVAAGQSYDLYRDLYAAAAQQFVDHGCFVHYVVIPAQAALVDIWCSLGFGHQQAHALRALGDSGAAPAVSGVEIRRGTAADREALVTVSHLTGEHMVAPPTFAPLPPEALVERQAGYGEVAGDKEAVVWLAFHEQKIAGFQIYYPVEVGDSDLLAPPASIELAAAATIPALRGRGIGALLTHRGLAWARSENFRLCLTDWRIANLSADRFWRDQGFRPIYFRMSRRLDPNIAWARGSYG